MRKINILALVLSMALTSCTVIAPVTASRAEIGDLRGVSETTVFFGIELNKKFGEF